MKSFFLILVVVLMNALGYAAQPLRKPFAQISVDGKPSKSSEVITVRPGQKLLIEVKVEGGRRDYCKYPDIYADMNAGAKILTRGETGMSYQLGEQMAVWKLIGEEAQFSGDDFLSITNTDNPMNAEITVSDAKFAQSYLKITAKTTWEFTRNGKTTEEVNVAEETLYFKMAGQSDVWFSTPNVQARGLKNESVQEKLEDVQSVCDSIEQNFYRLNFGGVQQNIRNLQNAVNILKSTIDQVTAANPSYKVKVAFIGLPSDNPYKDMVTFSPIKDSWTVQLTLAKEQQLKMGQLPGTSSKESEDQLVKTIFPYADWQDKLPENTFILLERYIAGFDQENARIPEKVYAVAKENKVDDYPQTVTDFNGFLERRVLQIPGEIQIIGATLNRLQAVKLFDGMLRGYLSSINWAEWKDTRQQ